MENNSDTQVYIKNMNAVITQDDKHITIKIPFGSSMSELDKWSNALYNILKFALFNKGRAYTWTLYPQDYSLGYEFDFFRVIEVHGQNVLVNSLEKIDDDILSKIVTSEEFDRGLLKIGLSDDWSESDLVAILKNDYSSLKIEVIMLEDDGYTLYWYNPSLPKHEIDCKMTEIFS